MSRRVALVTDSTAMLPPDVVAARDITVVPLQVVVGATSYDEGVDPGPRRRRSPRRCGSGRP
jgi:fatty acid-binding protein DegV